MPTSPQDTEVLVVGAGPTGLVLALWLARAGVRVRIVDKAVEPGTTSRALAVQARTLELYRPLGLAGDVVANGLRFAAANMWSRGRRVGHAEFGNIGQGLSPFPYLLIFPQEQHERLLIDHLDRAGVRVERGAELLGFEDRGDQVTARVRQPGGAEAALNTSYLIGCDGASSRVRESLGTGFPGGTYDRIFYVADVQARGPVINQELNVALDDADFLAVFPMKGDNVVRLVGTVQPAALNRHATPTWSDVSQRVLERMRIQVEQVNWFSTYHVHHRVAARFRHDRVFLAGDAAHIHSPVGGQGMNTGIGDAINLAWKLAAVLQGRANATLLDSYEPERIPFANRLVTTTDRVFTFATRDGPIARAVRFRLVPLLLPWLMNRTTVRRFMFRTVSQTLVNYRHSPLSLGRVGSVHGGDRLPWVKPEDGATNDNFTPLTSLDWQLHVYGDASVALRKWCDDRALPLHAFPWRESMHRTGLARDATYLVRPDGYVALAGATAASLERYFEATGVRATAGGLVSSDDSIPRHHEQTPA
jgi:2-polyprenyl-6-methoxyphenol hydroxylase-like FAD-dependent oxidoreductase